MWNTRSLFNTKNFLLVQKGNVCRKVTHVVPGYKNLVWLIESNFQDYIKNNVGCSGASIVIHPLVKQANSY